MRWRRRTSNGLLALTFVLAIIAGPVFYASAIVDDEDRFVAAADRIISQEEVRSAVADEVTALTFSALEADEIVADVLPDEARTFAVPITQIATTQLTNAAFRLLDTDVVIEARHAAVRETHRQLTAEASTVTLDLRGVAVSTTRDVAGSTAAAAVAKLVTQTDAGIYVLADEGSSEADLVAAIRAIPDLGALTFLIVMAVVIAAIAVAPDRRRALERSGLALAAGAFLASVLWSAVVYAVLVALVGEERRALGEAVAEGLTGDFSSQQSGAIVTGLGIALCGLLLGDRPAAVALRSLPRALWTRDSDAAMRRLGEVAGDNPPFVRLLISLVAAFTLWSWDAPTRRVVLTILALAAVAHALLWALTSRHPRAQSVRDRAGWGQLAGADDSGSARIRRIRQNVVITAAVALVFWPSWTLGLVVRFAIVLACVVAVLDLRDAVRLARANDVEDHAIVERGAWRRRGMWLAGGLAASLLVGGLSTSGAAASATDSTGCNGHDALCDRPVDELVFAGSHKAMSSTDLGWRLAMQTGDIVAQLDHGVRALLIDTHYWADGSTVEGGDQADAALVIEGALADDAPRPGTWLCHGFCALGASDLEATLAQINLWLTSHPREVLMLVVQDEISVEDTFEAFEASGILDRVHRHEPGTAWPTLGELIAAGERVIVYAENEGSPDSWYQNAWESGFTETPFNFALESDFSCDANRGDDANPFFLVNHWVTTGIPVREAALDINGRDALLDRVEECEAVRGRKVSVLAVDFVETGDLIDVVDELNGVG
ncbi:MAG: hypothetical protein AAF567_18235 [Actinomycetota bacterium]